MREENQKELFLALFHTHTIAIRSAYPTETDRQLYHRLVDAIVGTGHTFFKKRNDGRYIVVDLPIGGEPTRVMTLYPNARTGKLDIDLSINTNCQIDDVSEDILMVLLKMLTVGMSISLSEAMSGVAKGQSELAKAIQNRQHNDYASR